MRDIKIFLRSFWVIINLSALLFLFSILYFMLQAISINRNYLILLPLILTTFVLTFFYIQISNQLTYIAISQYEIKVYKPLKFQKCYLNLKCIKGYSVSEVWYGRNLFSSKSFIIYPEMGNPIEIISLSNLNFNQAFAWLKKHHITKLGSEPYHTGIWKRKYKF